MDTALKIIGIILLGFLVNIFLKQSYNFIFFISQKPLLWIITVGIVGIAVWGISAAFSWSVHVPAWSSTIAFFMNLPPKQKNAEEGASATLMIDKIYEEMGIKNGRILYRLGLASFAISCLASWIIFYGEVCDGNECQSILENILF